MTDGWITLYDVTRDGIGFVPWLLAATWTAGLLAGGIGFRKARIGRHAIVVWLVAWSVLGGVGLGNVVYQYAANYRCLKAGSCDTTEGPLTSFHRQNRARKGDSERFVVGGHEFSYSDANLGGGGLRSSAAFSVPLNDGLYVRIWYRNGIICRLDVSTRLGQRQP